MSGRDRRGDRERERPRNHSRERDRGRYEREREKDRDRARDKDRDRERDRRGGGPPPARDSRYGRRSRSRSPKRKDEGRDRDRRGHDRVDDRRDRDKEQSHRDRQEQLQKPPDAHRREPSYEPKLAVSTSTLTKNSAASSKANGINSRIDLDPDVDSLGDGEQGLEEGEEVMDAENEEDTDIAALMGFGGFDSTKGKSVDNNEEGGVKIIQQRKWRQYMNRKGGFNRPLDKVK